MVTEYLKRFHEADRETIEDLLLNKVSDALTEEQKHMFVKTLLQDMRKDGTIQTTGSKTFGAKWILTHPPKKALK
jgi:ATP-dependent DNA helicase RecG